MTARRRRFLVRLGACVLISFLLAGLTALLGSVERLGRFEGIASDLAFPRGDTDETAVVLGIDARALSTVDDPWPWPRSVYAEMVRALDRAGARAIVFDVAFVDPRDDDAELAAAIRDAGNVVLISIASSPGDSEDEADDESAADAAGPSPSNGLQTFTLIPPSAPLVEAAAAVAQPVVSFDPTDGVVREVPLVVEDQQRRIVPALSLTAIAAATGADPQPIVRRPSGVQVGDRAIPTNDSYELRVSYSPELRNPAADDRAFPDSDRFVVSAADAFTDDLGDVVRDRVVFIGVTDVSLGDRVLAPVAKEAGLPGVMVQANAYNTMATRNYLSVASRLDTTLWVLFVSLVITLSVQFLPGWLAAVVAGGLVVFYWFVTYLRVDTGTIMNFGYPTLAVALAVPASLAVRYFLETKQSRRVNALFAQYVPSSVAEQLIDEGSVERAAEGARVEATAMFVDLRGFTSLSSTLTPLAVNTMLSDFYEFASRIILAHRGTVMTYIGDEVFAIFGAPVADENHTGSALACARELQESTDDLDAALARNGFDPMRFGIGVNAGELVVAHVGSNWRRQYTAIGDAVNVAARLTSQAGPGQVVLSEAVRAAAVPPPQVESMGPLQMKGVRADFQAWKLVIEHAPSGTSDRA